MTRIDVTQLHLGDRVVMINPKTGAWDRRVGWNKYPARISAIYPKSGAFQVVRYPNAGDPVGRESNVIWAEGTPDAKPYQHTGLWALASDFGYEPTRRNFAYSETDLYNRGWI